MKRVLGFAAAFVCVLALVIVAGSVSELADTGEIAGEAARASIGPRVTTACPAHGL